MWLRNGESRRSEKARAGLRHSRAKKRARRRLANGTDQVGSTRRLAWLLIETFWLVQERGLWPLSDRARHFGESLAWHTEDLAWTVRRRVVWPVTDRMATSGVSGLGAKRRSLTAGLACVAGVALIAGALVASGDEADLATADSDPALEEPSIATVTEEPRPAIVDRTEEPPDGPVLSGARPRFESSPPEEIDRAKRIIEAREARGQERDSDEAEEPVGSEPTDPSAEGEGGSPFESELGDPVAFDAERSEPTPREEARRVAFRFARAFAAYELGREGEAIDTAFHETAGRRLADELQQRPPRLPRDGRIPRAEIVNVVDGPREGRKLEVSVSLLRVESLAELRLELFRTAEGWRVGAVKG